MLQNEPQLAMVGIPLSARYCVSLSGSATSAAAEAFVSNVHTGVIRTRASEKAFADNCALTIGMVRGASYAINLTLADGGFGPFVLSGDEPSSQGEAPVWHSGVQYYLNNDQVDFKGFLAGWATAHSKQAT
jgi:hypothetical protein